MVMTWINMLVLNFLSTLRGIKDDERGDTNFISIIIILAIVVILVGVFLVFKDQILGVAEEKINQFELH